MHSKLEFQFFKVKLFLGSIFAFLLVFSTSLSGYIQNDLDSSIEISQSDSLEKDIQKSFSIYKHSHQHLKGVEFQEKNEKFKKLHIVHASEFIKVEALESETNKYKSFYLKKLITTSIARHILLEMFLI